MSVFADKRKNKRLNCFVPVEAKEGGFFEQSSTVDFSKGGIGFVSAFEIPIGWEIAIELDISEAEEPVLVMGKVKWVKRIADSECFRIGMNFERLIKGSKTRLNKYFSKS